MPVTMMCTPEMYWLEVGSRKILAVVCASKQVKKEPFSHAKSHLMKGMVDLKKGIDHVHLEKSCDVGSRGWSDRMFIVNACLSEKASNHFIMIADCKSHTVSGRF